jgi:hypothetical protein
VYLGEANKIGKRASGPSSDGLGRKEVSGITKPQNLERDFHLTAACQSGLIVTLYNDLFHSLLEIIVLILPITLEG